jgi:hypothetical protein
MTARPGLDDWTRGLAHDADITKGSAPSVILLARSRKVRQALNGSPSRNSVAVEPAAVELEEDAEHGPAWVRAALALPSSSPKSLVASALHVGQIWPEGADDYPVGPSRD